MAPRLTKTLQIRDIGHHGVNSDLSPWELPPSALTSGLNYRVMNNTVHTFGGYSVRTNFGVPIHHIQYVPAANPTWLACGVNTDSARDVFAWTGGPTWDRITGSTAYTTQQDDAWQTDFLGRIPIVNNPGDAPRYWPGQVTSNDLEIVPWDASNSWADVGFTCKSIRAFRTHLIAMNMREGVNEYPDKIRWSHPADAGFMPISWDPADPQYVANEVYLGGSGGAIQDGRPLRDAMAIYRDRGVPS